ncbi:MAG TPA: peptide chain release factor N(5)-glutamine methyltransferase [Solirubrobacteraceae bacterium]|nr:peptide chain release factor N(5)-glutamine methyltransferase [Solirubrobacteraceae bacterium]
MPRSPDRLIGRTSVRDALDSAVIALTAAGCETPRLDAELLLAAAMDVGRAAIVSDPGRELEPDAARRFQGYAARRREREPVAYIVGSTGFRSIELAVDPRVLIPRPETEHLVEAVLDLPAGSRVCDVGTGSGAIALALKAERPDLEVVATDASAEALAVARENAARLGLDVELHHGDLLAGVTDELDAVVSNPPYVEDGAELAPEIVRHEPALALRAGPSGLDVIRRLLPAAGATAAHTVALEIGAGQSAAVADLIREAGFPEVATIADLAGIERVLVGSRLG